jgi:micrococcal nuclease
MTSLLISIIAVIGLLSANVWAENLNSVEWLTCYDGDTCSFNVLLPPVLGSAIGVRFSGIDAPEIHGKCEKENSLALLARDFLRMQLVGASVLLVDVARDKYFRIDATVFANGVNLNQLLVQEGYAVPYSGSGARHDWCQ